MTKEEYNAEAEKIRQENPLTYPPDAVALGQYARAFRILNDKMEAERQAKLTPPNKV
jgi:hypothetical protein